MPRRKDYDSPDEASELRRWGITIRSPRSPEPTQEQPDYAKRTTRPRRILPLLGISEGRNEQAADLDEVVDHSLRVDRRRRARFAIRVYFKPGRDPRQTPRAELWRRTGDWRKDPSGIGGVWRLLKTVPPEQAGNLEAEAERLNGGRPLGQGEIARVLEPAPETRGRPGKHLSEYARDRLAWARKEVTLDYIRNKYSKGRRCPWCRTFLPNSWPRKKACSPRCEQRAYLARKKRGKPLNV